MLVRSPGLVGFEAAYLLWLEFEKLAMELELVASELDFAPAFERDVMVVAQLGPSLVIVEQFEDHLVMNV
jgi:hypothetical protein